jgi:protein subunit release factor A
MSVIVEIRAAEGGDDAKSLERRDQLGSGMRGDKRRTIRCHDGVVVDHVTGRRWELRAYLRGNW